MIKGRLLRQGDYLGLSRWARGNPKDSSKTELEHRSGKAMGRHRQRETSPHDVRMRMVYVLEKARERLLPSSFQKEPALFSPSKTDLGCLTSGTIRQ